MEKKAAVALSLLILLQAFQVSYFVLRNDTNPSWDEAWHLSNTLLYKNFLFSGRDLILDDVFRTYPIFKHGFVNYPHPNVFYLLSSFLPLEFDEIILVQMLYFSVLILATYGIGETLFGWKEGVFAAFLLATYPLVSNMSKFYLLDLCLAAFVALTLHFLTRAQYFRDRKHTILFIASLVAGMYTKVGFGLFVFPAVFYTSLTAIASRKHTSKVTPLLVLMILAVTVLISSIRGEILDYALELITTPTDINNLQTAILLLINRQISLLYFSAFTVGTILFIKSRKSRMLMLTLILPYLLLTYTGNLNARYMMPSLYSFALISSAGILSIRNETIKNALILLFTVLGLLQIVLISFAPDSIPSKSVYVGNREISLAKSGYWDYRRPHSQKPDIRGILDSINSTKLGKPPSVCIVAETSTLNDVNIPYNAIKYGYSFSYMVGNGCDPLVFDYVIAGPITKTPRSFKFENSSKRMGENAGNFNIIYSHDGVRVYRNSHPQKIVLKRNS